MTERRTLSEQEPLDLRRRRMAASPPILRGGFRPFFLGAAVWAVLAILIWMFALSGDIAFPRGLDSLAWHRHEMVFGFAGAAVAGFLLTAIANWTGRPPIAGWPLASLIGLWAAGRLALLVMPGPLVPVAAVLDVSLYIVLAAIAVREVVASSNRNLPVSLLVLLFGAADALDYLCITGQFGDDLLGIRCGLSILIIMISVVGGRIIPTFTRNWMAKRGISAGLPAQPGAYDVATIAASAAALVLWILVPAAKVTGAVLIASAVLQAVRLARWRGLATVKDPLLLVLHIGYAWLVVGLMLLGLAILSVDVPRTAAIHALAVGAVGTLILGVTTRASLGHTGRALRAAFPTVAGYVLISLAGLTRLATAFDYIDYLPGLYLSATLWVAAFLLFLVVYGPILAKPRVQADD